MGGTPITPRPAVKTKALNCPGCGASLAVRAAEHTLTVVCENCSSILDAKDPNFQILQQFEAKVRVKPFIPLGTRGKWRGDTYEVIGFQVRTIYVAGIHYSWREYLLFNPYRGFRYITEYDGHWNDVRTVRAAPEEGGGSAKPTVKFRGQTFTHFQTARAKTTFVLGEFPWQVRVNEEVEARDHIAPPHILSSESTEGETVWSLGEYTRGEEIWKAFQLPGSAPQPTGIFANQPSPYQGRVKSVWKLYLGFLFAVLALAVFFSFAARRDEVFRQIYRFDKSPGVEASFVTPPFELKGRTSTVEVTTLTDLNNNWAFFSYALINEETGQAYDFGREVSYYFGRDSDGAWTEGSQADTALVPSVPPGRYYLRVEPEMEQGRSVSYEVRVRRDVPSGVFYWIASVFLLVPPIVLSIRAASFEGRRWAESDYAGGGSDDNGDDE